jgi:hypothetical protein
MLKEINSRKQWNIDSFNSGENEENEQENH